MGHGYNVKCKKCGFHQNIFLGVGFSAPMIGQEILEQIKQGKYGKRFMEDAAAIKNPVVWHEQELYFCEHCGNWKVDTAVNLCAPVDEDAEPDFFVSGADIGDTYNVARSKTHRCGKCSHIMRPVTNGDKIACPDCGEELERGGMIMWD